MQDIPLTKARSRMGKAGSIILPLLADLGAASLLMLIPGASTGLKHIYGIKRELSLIRVEREMKLLERSGYVNRKRYKSGETYELSSKGRFLLFSHSLQFSEKANNKNTPKKWDGIWRVIVFDVSERDRTHRDLLRRTLHSYGFLYLQQSVWVYPYPCDDYIQTLKDHMGLKNNVVYIQAKYIEGDHLLKKQFGLP